MITYIICVQYLPLHIVFSRNFVTGDTVLYEIFCRTGRSRYGGHDFETRLKYNIVIIISFLNDSCVMYLLWYKHRDKNNFLINFDYNFLNILSITFSKDRCITDHWSHHCWQKSMIVINIYIRYRLTSI